MMQLEGANLLVFPVLGVAAGILTTIAGQGGGLMLLLACSTIVGPHAALAMTAPALLLGNLHRSILLRAHIDRAIAFRIVAGAVPGALVGGFLVGVTPTWGLRAILVVLTLVAVAKALGLLRFHVPRRALVPVGVGLGAMTGTSGGAGVLFAPVLLSTGLTGRAFVGTSSVVALSVHVGRVVGYAGLGLFSRALFIPTVAIAIAIFAGNALGDRLRTALIHRAQLQGQRGGSDATDRAGRVETLLEYGTLVVCVVLSVAGLG